jgi:4-hydroxy-2-oxoglutarate aldolase
MKLQGILPPLTVPFGTDGSVDHLKLRANIERYNRTRVSGYVVNGSTGESVLLRWDEIYGVWEIARRAAASGRILIAGSGAESTSEAIEHTNRAAALGYDFALVRTPSFYKPVLSVELEAEHYLRVADAAKIPVLVYSVPAFTGYTVEASLLARVASHPNIVGIKDSSGNVPRVAEFRAVVPPDFSILCGSPATLVGSLANGANGGVLALACALPDLCCEIYEAFRAGDAARADAVQEKLTTAAALIGTKYGIPGLKYALDQLGYFGGLPRRPLLPVSDAARKEIDALLLSLAVPAPARG